MCRCELGGGRVGEGVCGVLVLVFSVCVGGWWVDLDISYRCLCRWCGVTGRGCLWCACMCVYCMCGWVVGGYGCESQVNLSV